jgi:hypothetical protein
MQIEALGIVAVAFGCLGWLLGPAFTIQVFLVSTLLGAAAAIVLTSLGFATIQPAHLLLGFVVCSVISRQRSVRLIGRSAAFPNEGCWLLLTASYAVLSALLLPRIFAGSTYVFAIARTEIGPGILSLPLAPTSGNITQLIYFLGDILCFFAFYIYAGEPDGLKAVVRGILACTAVNLLFALIDIGSWMLHAGDLLAVIRTANYRMLDDATVGGFKRIVGSFPEASTFAYFTLGWFAFCTRLWLAGFHSRVTAPLALLSFCALLFATSSTGYAGTAAFLAALLVASIGQVLTRPVSRRTLGFTALAPVIAGAVLIGLHLHQPSWQVVTNMVDKTIVSKMSTESGVERGMWNQQALTNFNETRGLGAGVGSVRASSFPVAVLGNIGAIGAVTYGSFLIAVLFRRKSRWTEPYPAACQSAARWACATQLIGASVAGSFIDLGLPFFIFAGLACAGPERSRSRIAPAASQPLAAAA